jgi:Uncharacterized protein conserved in bacteria
MGWVFKKITKEQIAEINRQYQKKGKFIIDENLGDTVVKYIRDGGFNVKGVSELGLQGRCDDDVFNIAYKEKRIILTQDKDFLDNERFPLYRNPGVILIPDCPGKSDLLFKIIAFAVAYVGSLHEVVSGKKFIISENLSISAIFKDKDTGTIVRNRIKLAKDGYYEWED